jgi:hypothetical protein
MSYDHVTLLHLLSCYLPAGFWAGIAEYIQPSLSTEQVERLAIGFQVYLEKVRGHVLHC